MIKLQPGHRLLRRLSVEILDDLHLLGLPRRDERWFNLDYTLISNELAAILHL